MGMTDFIAKPIDPVLMLETLAKVLGIVRQPLSTTTASHDSVVDRDDQTALVLPGFDTERLRLLEQMLAGRENILRSIRQFVEAFIDIEQELSEWLATDDRSAACARLHAFKGAAGNLGAGEVAALADKMESKLKQGDDINTELEQFGVAWQLIIKASQSSRDAAITSIEAVDPAAFRQDLQVLCELLQANKLVSIDFLNSLASGLQTNTFNRLKKAIMAYDYDAALQILKDLP